MTKEVSILNTSGKQVGQIALDDKIFGIEPNLHVMHLALRRQLNSARQGSACTKTRAEVSGGGKKPWKQKGTGRARAGSLRSPLFAGGGVIFGPKPRDYAFAMPQKARRLALRSALSARLENMVLVDDFSQINQPKTKLMVEALNALKVSGKILLITDVDTLNKSQLELAARNLPQLKIILSSNLNVKDLLEADNVVVTQAAIAEITERLSK